MIRFINNENMAFNAQYIAAFAALRHRVFVERLRWDIESDTASKGFEYDRYDTSDATYVVICNAADEVVAGLRLLKTTKPFLLEELYPELVASGIPASETVYEVTRFVVDPCPIRTAGCRDLGSQLVWALQSYGLMREFTRFVSASYVGMERLLRAAGCRFRRLGEPRRFDHRIVVPLEFEISDDVLALVEARLLGTSQPQMELASIDTVIAGLSTRRPQPPVMVA